MNRQGIEGVADHLTVVGYRQIEDTEHYCCNDGSAARWWGCPSSGSYAIVEPDNVYNVYDLADVKIPEGYEFAEFREPVENESFITYSGRVDVHCIGYSFAYDDSRRIIVKPVAKKIRRVLVVEHELAENHEFINCVSYCNSVSDVGHLVEYRIEEREID